jgi:hypothetical protein
MNVSLVFGSADAPYCIFPTIRALFGGRPAHTVNRYPDRAYRKKAILMVIIMR